MFRQSLHQGGTPVQQRYLGCPAANLFNPVIPPAVGKVDNLMTMSRSEMADLISRQQGDAEKVIQNLRENQQEQLEAPASAMEEYYMAILKDVRMKEQAEIDNAYLTQQQKNDLQGEALARKAGIDGNIMRYADELASDERDYQAATALAEEQIAEAEARHTGGASASVAGYSEPGGEMSALTAASMGTDPASAASAASAGEATASESVADAVLTKISRVRDQMAEQFKDKTHDRIRVIIHKPGSRKSILKAYSGMITQMVSNGLYSQSSGYKKLEELRVALDRGSAVMLNSILGDMERQVLRRSRV